jgi:ethanolamine utilization cobalamin adenosyltransferase
MRNITDLRNSLVDNYEKMKTKQMELKDGKELANTAGKILSSINIELKYNDMLGNKTKIDFLER